MFTETDIARLVGHFYTQVRADDLLGPIFAAKITPQEWPRHEAHIADFWSSIFLKTGRFKGNPMLKHAALPGLTPEHFTHWLSLFRSSAEHILSPTQAEAICGMAGRVAQSLQMGIAFNLEQAGHAKHPFTKFGLTRRKHQESNNHD